MSEDLTAIGLMSSTSVDGIEVALLNTDGDVILEAGPTLQFPYSRDLKVWIHRAMKAALEGRDGASEIGKAAGEVTLAHISAVEAFLEETGIKRKDVDVIGFHGHTILHNPRTQPDSLGRSWQIGDGSVLAEETRIDVINNFRSADIAAGGDGAPFMAVYYRALIAAMEEHPECAVGVIDLGEKSTITYVPENARATELIAFDGGPGNKLVREWLALKTGEPRDEDGETALAGRVDEEALRMMLLSPYLRRKLPKTLDRFDFKLDHLKSLTVEDGAATLTALTAACIDRAEAFYPELPGGYIVCGSGRHNPAMMQALQERLDAPVVGAEDAGWRGDDLEAECFAYLAVRSLKKLPLSFPMTTRVPRPMLGGVFHRAPI
ncbi:anhydro-N-acetylmuramic acid kinase [Hyphococcus formosus]|uniref:anhydro-N-acetylmuramic acid kinase n=1 Tax=Hyphococcus formosus TaxID=3143534 RepID=UPI00398AB8C6